jgi:ADP-ribose pyrophosphatase YjhB (NUDIX family)
VSLPGYVARIRERLGPEEIVLPGTAAIVRDGEGRILFVRHAPGGRWGLPGGIPERGESPAVRTVEEVREETGLDVEPVRLLGVYAGEPFRIVYPNGDAVAFMSVVFECRLVGGELRPDGVETFEARFLTLAEAHDELSDFARGVLERVEIEPRAFDYD